MNRADRANRPANAAKPPAAATPGQATPQKPTPPKAPAKPKAAPRPAWTFPMGKFELTSCYGPRWGTEHQGIDFANVPGTPILAAGGGTVISAGWNAGGYGNMVIIQHGPSTYTLYGHSQRVLVHVGQHVTAGQPIALEGTTGDSTGPHLHFEVWNGMWSRIEPASFLRAHGVKLNGC
jgi:murein DD-endopeptidase MepM/ murein hydrolase activator NlpD